MKSIALWDNVATLIRFNSFHKDKTSVAMLLGLLLLMNDFGPVK